VELVRFLSVGTFTITSPCDQCFLLVKIRMHVRRVIREIFVRVWVPLDSTAYKPVSCKAT